MFHGEHFVIGLEEWSLGGLAGSAWELRGSHRDLTKHLVARRRTELPGAFETKLLEPIRRPANQALVNERRFGDNQQSADRKEPHGTLSHDGRRSKGPGNHQLHRSFQRRTASGILRSRGHDRSGRRCIRPEKCLLEEARPSDHGIQKNGGALPDRQQEVSRKASPATEIEELGGGHGGVLTPRLAKATSVLNMRLNGPWP